MVENFEDSEGHNTVSASIEGTKMGLDIGPKTIALYRDALKEAGCVFWNGPMGVYERKPFDTGSLAMAEALAQSSAYSVVGGGDSAAAAIDSGFSEKIDHISTGGGASLEFIQGVQLPGLQALKVRQPEAIEQEGEL